jgi:hypothetical protein
MVELGALQVISSFYIATICGFMLALVVVSLATWERHGCNVGRGSPDDGVRLNMRMLLQWRIYTEYSQKAVFRAS